MTLWGIEARYMVAGMLFVIGPLMFWRAFKIEEGK